MVVFHLQKDSGKYGLKVKKKTRLFGSFQRKISVFPDEMFQTKVRVPFLQSHTEFFRVNTKEGVHVNQRRFGGKP